MATTTKTKRKFHKGMLNLQPGGKLWQSPEKLRTVHVSARVSPESKERLKKILDEMDLSVADLLEKIATGDAKVLIK